MTRPFILVLSVGLLAGGCVHMRPKIEAQYVNSSAVPGVHEIKRGGDFALYYDSNRKPEIPVRLRRGDEIGFVRSPDGRVQAVAGEFRMNIDADAGRAAWRRLNTRDE